MALDTALSLVGPVIEVVKFVGKPILRQLNYLCCFTSNISGLKDEANKLDDAIAGLEGEIEIARDRRQEKPVPEVETWLIESKAMKDEINGILNEAPNVESGCSKLGARFSLSKKAKKKTESTKAHRVEKPPAKFLPPPIAAEQEVPLGKTFEFESRKELEEDIMTALRGGEVNMLGIHGMGGLGKTTMAKKLMNRVLHESVFEEVVIATVSQDVNISRIQDEIGGQLGLEKLKEEKSESARVKILHSRLSDTKRTLLVLDDVWDALTLESIGIPRDSQWCTILFTSRNRDTLHDMDVGKIFGMKVLSEEEAWSFFRERAGTCVDDRVLNPIAKKVAKECAGLPINLAAVGAGLKDQRNAAIWNHTLAQLKQSVPENVRYDKQNYNPLKLSYEYLESKEAQSIFLLCCLFPEDADIPVEHLTYICMGLHIFEDDVINMQDARNKMCALTEFLNDRSLLLESDEEDCVKMHDVVRDVCILIGKEEGYIGKDGCTWISSSHLVVESKEFLNGSRCPNLELLFLDRRCDDLWGFKLDDALLEGMRELRVLCIQNYSSLTTLPCPTQSIGKLKTLILDSCDELETISVVGELVNLEILICRDCYSIEKLPAEMKGLNRLKLLDLTGCNFLLSIERGIISSLVGLEELKMLGSFDNWEAEEREERENASIKELEALPNLACLEIDIHDPSILAENMPLLSKKIVRFFISNKFRRIPSGISKAMRLCLERETRLGDWIEKQLMRDTEYLDLEGDGACNVDLANSQNIRRLELSCCKSMKNLLRTSGGSDDATVLLPSIEYLKLESLLELQEICDGPISSTSFRNLSSIYIWNCHSLRNLGQLSMAGKDCLPQLEQLYISSCNMMEQVFLWNDREEAIESHVITKVFPKLKEVQLWNLPNLTTLYQGIQGIEFPLLQKMKIEECPNWKNIIIGSSSVDIDDDDSLHLLCQQQKVSFGSSVEVLRMMNHNPFRGHKIPSSLFTRLEVLAINKCVGHMSLLTLSMAAKLVSLRELFIEDCEEMIKVIEDEQQQERKRAFPKLKKLHLKKLPKLVSFCDSKCEVELLSLEEVVIEKCPNMENFIMTLVATLNLEVFGTDLTTYAGVAVDVAFNSLKELMIRKNEHPFDHHKISVSLFNGLEKLMFYDCQGSASLFSSSSAGNLVNLKVLHMVTFIEIVKVIEDEEDDEKVMSGGERAVVFPKLEEIYLINLPQLVRFCEWKYDIELPSLRQVYIQECPNMENFSMGFVSASKLETFYIDFHDATKDLNAALHQHYVARQEKENEEEESSQRGE